MKHKRLWLKNIWLPLIMVSIVLALLLPGFAGTGYAIKAFQSYTTRSFLYATDTTLESRYSSRNFGSSTECYVDGTGGGGGERSTLLQWNISALPRNSMVSKATIYLRVDEPSGDTFNVYGLKKKWIESEATWQQASKQIKWANGGASGVSDRDSIQSGTLYAKKAGTAAINLDPDLVEKWLQNPQLNYGVIISSKVRSSSDRIGFYCSETSQSTQRPKLVIEYR